MLISVYVVYEDAKSVKRAAVRPIGEVIDEQLARHAADVELQGDTEVLDARFLEERLLCESFDPMTGKTGLRPIKSLIRHAAPHTMFLLTTACGRSATMTGDHNLWVLRDGRLMLIDTADARATDYVPLPESIAATDALSHVDVLPYLAGEPLFVSAPDAIASIANDPARARELIAVIGKHGLDGYAKVYANKHDLRGKGIEVAIFQDLLAQTDGLHGNWEAASARVGGKHAEFSLPASLALTPGFLRLLGYYIAEGCSQRGYITISNQNPAIRAEIESAVQALGMPLHVRASGDFQISSTALARLFSRWCGSDARSKRLPMFWPNLDDGQLGSLLGAYFDGDGTVGHASDVSATTASKALASDLMYALQRFGIWARLSKRWKRASGTPHEGDWYYQVSLSGQGNLTTFRRAIGFVVANKRDRLAAESDKSENSNVDVIPISGDRFKRLRLALRLTAAQLAEQAGISRAAVQLIENGKRRPQRATLMALLTALQLAATNAEMTAEWHFDWQYFKNLCGLRWTRIASVEPAHYEHASVYDFCVPGSETFLAGAGGFYVHNTFTIAKLIESVQKPTLIMAHNKTLAAQLYSEFKEFFPNNAVEYFVSYYDYYQPEAYVAKSDLYIEKDSSINDEIDRLRLAATSSLMSRRDVIIVASVSCIYGVGNPEDYGRFMVKIAKGEVRRREIVLRMLVAIQYQRNDISLTRSHFRVRGDTLEVQPAYTETAYRIEFFGDEVERLTEIDVLTGEILNELDSIEIYPAKHYVTAQEKVLEAVKQIEIELEERIKVFKDEGKLLEAQRIEQRVRYDLEMMREVGFTNGIENYSRHLDGRTAGTPPFTLLDYFPDDFLLVVDESHMTIPQIGGMFNGDRARKQTLVDYGFRLPSALDNRPLQFDEFEKRFRQVVYVSATPGPYELKQSQLVAEQVIRPTGIIDPVIEVKPVKGQVDDLIGQIRERTARGERVLVTTLTKRMSEDLTQYLLDLGIRVQYLHSEVQTVERIEILRDLRLGEYDVVVGINLLREGLDLPEVSLVAILDADKEGFLRSGTSLIQTIGRAARHVEGKVIMYADRMTDSMKRAIDETTRRRAKQVEHNTAHGIEPKTIYKAIKDLTDRVKVAEDKSAFGRDEHGNSIGARLSKLPKAEVRKLVSDLEEQMRLAAKELEFEKAAMLRDQVLELRQQLNDIDATTPEWEKVRRMGNEMAKVDAMAAGTDAGDDGKTATYKKPTRGRPGSGGRKR